MTAPQLRPDTPLGDLIAGRISQAEYRRRMGELEARSWDEIAEILDRRGRRSPDRSGAVIVYLALALAAILLAVAIVGIASLLAAPRAAANPTAPSPASDVAGLALASPMPARSSSGSPLPGAPRPQVEQRYPAAGDGFTPVVGGAPQTLDPRVGREGDITHMGDDYPWPMEYLAIPLGPGIHVRICGPAACRDMVSTDAGPNRERLLAGVIADVSWQRFETLCGVQARFGHCPGSWIRIVAGSPTLPPTDTPEGVTP